ncbi:probable adenylate kinase 7, mitochondrial isoform X2 [Musa acuminata AAA Group]|uniref:probable adenylate kinase 7, mitochondrial isoform X2 n=1 Tax=Musa acuminata AAA Group TaxID=214697 RepID=UPI0031DA8AC8
MARPRNLRGVISSFSGNSCHCATLGFLKLNVTKHSRTDGVEEEEIEVRVSRHCRDPPLRRPRSTIPRPTGVRAAAYAPPVLRRHGAGGGGVLDGVGGASPRLQWPQMLVIANVVNEGRLVPEEIIFGLLSKRLEEGYQRGEIGFILDGIPRTRIQAEILDQIANIDLVVNLQCRDDCLVKKHFGADICSHCGKTFDSSNSESTSLNLCLATRTRHAQLKSSAAVDMKDSCMEKFRVYSEQIKQLEEYYMKQKKLLDVQVTGGPGETWQGLLAALHLQHMDTATSQKLTV